jgi:hypothetical protein
VSNQPVHPNDHWPGDRLVRSLPLVLLCIAPVAGAQVPTKALGAPEKVFDATFTNVSGFRELADGRLIISDFGEKTVQVLDPRSSAPSPVGRQGAGPGEWGLATRLWSLPGDSTLLPDPINGRFLLIGPDAKPVTTFRIAESSPANFGNLAGVDAQGGMYFERVRPPANPGLLAPSPGIVDILRYDRSSQRTDTVGQLQRAKGETSGAKTLPGGMVQSYTNLPLATIDVSVVTPEGRVAVVRGTDYRIDWIGRDGRLVRGPAAQPSQIRVTTAEKEAFVKSQIRPGQISVRGPLTGSAGPAGGGSGAAGARSGGAVAIPQGVRLDDPDMTWPEVKPPFLSGAVVAAPDGRVWVHRTRAYNDSVPVYDVFDASGKVVQRVSLPKGTRLVGFGRGVVYLVRPDEDDLLRVGRYRLP